MVTNSKQRHWKSYLTIFSQNCLGLKTEARRTELLDVLEQRRAFAVCLQETWRPGSEDVIVGSWRCLGIGPELQQGRGTKGVAIYLSRTASRAYDAADCQCYHEGLRNIAVRLMANTAGGGRRSIARSVFLLNSYAPTSGHSDQEWDDYYRDLSSVLGHMQNGDLLVWCTDGNASIGRSTGGDTRGAAVGPHGLDHINASGRRLCTFLELHELYAMTTHFHKKAYGTWWHPASPGAANHIRSITSSLRLAIGNASWMLARDQASSSAVITSLWHASCGSLFALATGRLGAQAPKARFLHTSAFFGGAGSICGWCGCSRRCCSGL